MSSIEARVGLLSLVVLTTWACAGAGFKGESAEKGPAKKEEEPEDKERRSTSRSAKGGAIVTDGTPSQSGHQLVASDGQAEEDGGELTLRDSAALVIEQTPFLRLSVQDANGDLVKDEAILEKLDLGTCVGLLTPVDDGRSDDKNLRVFRAKGAGQCTIEASDAGGSIGGLAVKIVAGAPGPSPEAKPDAKPQPTAPAPAPQPAAPAPTDGGKFYPVVNHVVGVMPQDQQATICLQKADQVIAGTGPAGGYGGGMKHPRTNAFSCPPDFPRMVKRAIWYDSEQCTVEVKCEK